MKLRLFANETEQRFAQYLKDDSVRLIVDTIDISHCILANPDQLLNCLSLCTYLRSLYCVSCPFRGCDVLRLLLHRLRLLERLHFSLIAEHDMAHDMTAILQYHEEGLAAPNLTTMYAEVRGASNLALLEAFVSCCPNLSDLHIHFLHGELPYAILYCQGIVDVLANISKFTFSSEVQACQDMEIPRVIDLRTSLLICANVTYFKRGFQNHSSTEFYLAPARGSRELPPQFVITAVYRPKLLEQQIRSASKVFRQRKRVRCLSLILLPQELEFPDYPTVGVRFKPSLHEFFVSIASSVVELNVNSFHFDVDLDLTELILNAMMLPLMALSAPPCGIRHPSALQRLAAASMVLEELDVRVYRRHHLVRCVVCESHFVLQGVDIARLHAGVRRSFCRLTFSDLPSLASLSFLERSRVTHLRLINLPENIREVYPWLSYLLVRNDNLRFLLLQQDWLPFGEDSFLILLSRLRSLHYLCLMTSVSASDDTANKFLCSLGSALPHLEMAHAHYRRDTDGAGQRVTWLRTANGPGSLRASAVLLRDSPCVLCSTATFVGLAKPQRPEIVMAP